MFGAVGIVLDKGRSLTVLSWSILNGRTLTPWKSMGKVSKLCSRKAPIAVTGKMDYSQAGLMAGRPM